VENPFSFWKRPAKAFVIIRQHNQQTFFMAPIVRDSSNKNYYIYNKTDKAPTLLSDWVNSLINMNGTTDVHFNVCNGYGTQPDETCEGKGFQYEGIYSHPETTLRAKPVSAKRDFKEDWHTKIRRDSNFQHTIYGESVFWEDDNKRPALLDTVAVWPNYKVIQDNFNKLRDFRYFNDTEVPGFGRRVTWLFPDDGCWTRDAAVIKDLFGPFMNMSNRFSRPSKIFAFGSLCVNTKNSPQGAVAWWYHTAPIVRDGETNEAYVLDPSVNPYAPEPVEKWVADISQRTGVCSMTTSYVEKFNICNGYGADPYETCKNTYDTEDWAERQQEEFRIYERERQAELGRKVNEVLGDNPPWKS
jgi:hypothetical protein